MAGDVYHFAENEWDAMDGKCKLAVFLPAYKVWPMKAKLDCEISCVRHRTTYLSLKETAESTSQGLLSIQGNVVHGLPG